MANRIDELERLADLHRQGTLTADEYERAKANLLGGGSTVATGSSLWHRHRSLITSISGGVGLLIAIFIIKPLISGGGGTASSDGGSSWVITTAKDAMTDAQLRTATRTFSGATANVAFTVTCASNGLVTYQAASYDKEGEPVAMHSGISDNGDSYISFQYRVDDGKPASANAINPRFNNVVALTAAPIMSPADDATARRYESGEEGAISILRASKITFALHLASSDETIVVDQADAGLKGVIAPCIDAQLHAIRGR